MKLYEIPKGTDEARCPRGCGAPVFWIETRRADGKGTVRMPIDTSVVGGSDPDSWSAGRGANHFEHCEN